MNNSYFFGEEWNDDMSLTTTKVHKNWKTKYNHEVEMSVLKYESANEYSEIKKRKMTEKEKERIFSN